jgi:hypothetical protein
MMADQHFDIPKIENKHIQIERRTRSLGTSAGHGLRNVLVLRLITIMEI